MNLENPGQQSPFGKPNHVVSERFKVLDAEDPIDEAAMDCHLVGYLTATYATLFRILGDPNRQNGKRDLIKVACQWWVRFADGTIASIYSYAEMTDAPPTIPRRKYRWHIASQTAHAVRCFALLLKTNEYEYLRSKSTLRQTPKNNKNDIPF